MMEEKKLTKEDIDCVRDVEGFPIAKDEDIIALSRPPYYTACPNPFIEDFIREHGTPYNEDTDDYHREPFSADISEGKNDPIYMAHTYHTKVPYKAIVRYILHYTNPGDIVFDGFCGTGMTGVAAQMCEFPELKDEITNIGKDVIFGARKAVLSDLSPAATAISYTYNSPITYAQFCKKYDDMLEALEARCAWLYETPHCDEKGEPYFKTIDGSSVKGRINYVIWSDVYVCPNCSKPLVFWNEAVDQKDKSVKERFKCKSCGAILSKKDCDREIETKFDRVLQTSRSFAKQVPVLIKYTYGNKSYERKPVEFDYELIRKIEELDSFPWYPTDRMVEGREGRRNDITGRTNIHDFFTQRNLYALGVMRELCIDDPQLRFIWTSIMQRASKLFKWSKNQAGPLMGTLYISSCIFETSIFNLLKSKANIYKNWRIQKQNCIVSTASLTDASQIPNNTIDYIFTDPPFGSNIDYSELSYMWESWIRVKTNNKEEAIMNNAQQKGLAEYQHLMERCFFEYYRVLKPGRWMTVEFHNSQNSVWNAIAEALLRAGFIVADVRTLDKKQGSFKQVTAASAVKQDLVISAYKPKEAFVRQFTERAGDPEMAWEFVRQHLQNVPIAPNSTGKIEVVSERQDYLLFDRMVAFHIMRGIPVPMDAHIFYAGLRERFIQRDGMFFLPDQVNEYDERRQKMELEDQQLSLFITDEKSAIIWLNAQLGKERQSYSEIQPKFLQDWHRNKFEQMPELLDMLKENFLQDEDGKWYVPDLSDKADLEKLRRKRLIKDFYDIYVKGTGRIKNARTEAIRVGFDECWKERNYSLIVKVGDRLPETVLQEDPALLMYYDNAANRM